MDTVKESLIWATAITLVLCSFMWSIAWYNRGFYTHGYCEYVEMTAQAGAVKVQQRCRPPEPR